MFMMPPCWLMICIVGFASSPSLPVLWLIEASFFILVPEDRVVLIKVRSGHSHCRRWLCCLTNRSYKRMWLVHRSFIKQHVPNFCRGWTPRCGSFSREHQTWQYSRNPSNIEPPETTLKLDQNRMSSTWQLSKSIIIWPAGCISRPLLFPGIGSLSFSTCWEILDSMIFLPRCVIKRSTVILLALEIVYSINVGIEPGKNLRELLSPTDGGINLLRPVLTLSLSSIIFVMINWVQVDRCAASDAALQISVLI